MGADLQNADLHNANLCCADLGDAYLYDTNFCGTNLKDAILVDTDLKNICIPWLVKTGNIGSRHTKTIYLANYDTVQCGCWKNYHGGTLSEFKARIDEVYSADSVFKDYREYRIDYLSAIKIFESVRETYLKQCNGGKSSATPII